MDVVCITTPDPLSFQHEVDFGVNHFVSRSNSRIINGFAYSPSFSSKAHEAITEQYGRSVRVQGVGPVSIFLYSTRRTNPLNSSIKWDQRLLTFDPVALHHVTRNSNIYEKPWQTQRFISSFIGCGLLSAAGNVHKRQRRVATPAFSIQNLRAFAPIVFERGFRLRDRWRDIMRKDGGDEAVLDVCMWASRITFDVIGAAGSYVTPLPRAFNANSPQALTTTSTRLRMTRTSFSVHTGRCLSSQFRRTNK